MKHNPPQGWNFFRLAAVFLVAQASACVVLNFVLRDLQTQIKTIHSSQNHTG